MSNRSKTGGGGGLCEIGPKSVRHQYCTGLVRICKATLQNEEEKVASVVLVVQVDVDSGSSPE
jgi:hypothetical protein